MTVPVSMWRLPGSRRFLLELRDRFERGDQVTIVLPGDLDGGLLIAHAREEMQLFAHRALDAVALAARSDDPLVALARELDVTLPPGEVITPDRLLASPAATGHVVWLERIDALAQPAQATWGRLFDALARANRRCDADRLPPRFAAVTNGPVAALAPTDPGWSSAWWWGRLDWLDVALHVHHLDPTLDESLRAVAVELAGFDLDVAQRLVLEGIDSTDALTVALHEERSAREPLPAGVDHAVVCETAHPATLSDRWTAGVVDRFDGGERPFWHSCLFADEEGLVTLRRRVWRGQVRALLPRLEEWRVQLVEEAKREGFIAPDVPLDRLDFPDLHRAVRDGVQTRRRDECTQFAFWLRQTRNMIAHLEPVEAPQRREGEQLAARVLR